MTPSSPLDWAGKQQTAWLDGGWFVVEDSNHNLSLSLSIDVQGPSFNYSVEREGDTFNYVSQNGDTGLGLSPGGFTYKSWTGELDEAQLAPPDGTPSSIDTSAVTSDGAGDVVPYDFGTTATEPIKVTFTCNDADGPSDVASCPTPVTFTGPISMTLRVQASDWSGNVENNAFPVIIWPNGYNLPTISASATTADGKPYVAGTWTNQSVTVHYTCGDDLSGLASGACSAQQTISTDGITPSASGTARDNAGNTASASFGPIQVDQTPPTVLCQSAGFVYGQTNALVSATVSDTTSGPQGGQPGGTTTISAAVSTSAVGPSTVSLTGQDNAGNSKKVSCSYSVGQAQTSTSLTASINPSVQGQALTFTAPVAATAPGAGTPSGTVTFKDGSTTLGTGQLSVVNGTDQATFSTGSLAVGAHSITTSYGGDGNFTASTSPASTQYVNTNLSSYPELASGAYNLSNANLAGAYLVNASLAGASLSGSNLTGAAFTGTNLTGANLSSSNFKGANVTNAILKNANLSNSNIMGANFSGANLSGANLTKSTLKGATGLKTATLTSVIWSNTTCPDGTVSNNDGGTCLGHL